MKKNRRPSPSAAMELMLLMARKGFVTTSSDRKWNATGKKYGFDDPEIQAAMAAVRTALYGRLQ